MGVNYNRMNSSSFRSSRRKIDNIKPPPIKVYDAGERLIDATFGDGVTEDSFVADCDKVKCRFESGYVVVLPGGAVRVAIEQYNQVHGPRDHS